MVKLEPFPGFHQITRKDWLWQSFQRMQEKFGQDHFDFLARSLIVPQQRDELAAALREEPEAWWIVKPPGRNNGSGIYLINSEDEVPDTEEEEVLVQRYMARWVLIYTISYTSPPGPTLLMAASLTSACMFLSPVWIPFGSTFTVSEWWEVNMN